MVKCDVVSAHSREDALECFSVKDALSLFSDRMSAAVNIGKTAVLLVLAVRRRCHFEASARSVCVMFGFHFDADSCSDGRSRSWLPCAGKLMHRESLHSG